VTADQALAWLGGATRHLAGSALAVSDVRTELDRLRAIEGRALDVESRVNDSWTRPAPATARYILTGETS
jgi:hypothetical protein